jgi:hypothetical protein
MVVVVPVAASRSAAHPTYSAHPQTFGVAGQMDGGEEAT